MNVLISGASVAGPALAYWLGRYGFRPTVVEIAPELRAGGYAVDFRGPTHLTVLERMGILDDLRAMRTGGTPFSFVDETGRELAWLPPEYAGGDVEILRSDLSGLLYDRTKDTTEYVFGDSITSLTDTGDGVHVTFEHGAPRTFDLVIGADGVHSNVRRLAFGPEREYVRHLGYYIARWDAPGEGATAVLYNTPGRAISVSGLGAFAVFAADRLDYDRRDLTGQKRIVTDAFAGMGWRTPALLDALADAGDLYFDSINRVDVDHWSRGRIALLGDAGYGATIGGMGVGTAIVGAYILAGELATGHGFTEYEQRLRAYATKCQRGGRSTGMFLAPKTRTRIRLRNRMLNSRYFSRLLLEQAQKAAADVALEDYQAEAGSVIM